MIIWLAIGLVLVILFWMGAIEAFDQLDRLDREREEKERLARKSWYADRLIRYQERDY